MAWTQSIAKGCKKHRAGASMRKVVILLDDETFEEVAAGAHGSCSFAAQARMLIEVGLETLKADNAQSS